MNTTDNPLARRLAASLASTPIEQAADANMGVFADDLRSRGVAIETVTRRPEVDDGGRYGYQIAFGDGSTVEIQMPSMPLEQLRQVWPPDQQDTWDALLLRAAGVARLWVPTLDALTDDDEGPRQDLEPVRIHGQTGVLIITAAGGDVHLEIRDEPEGPTLGALSFDPDAGPVQAAVRSVLQQARRQRWERRKRIDRAMRVLLGDTKDHNALMRRLHSLVTSDRVAVDVELDEAAERFRVTATQDGHAGTWVSVECGDKWCEDCAGCGCKCHKAEPAPESVEVVSPQPGRAAAVTTAAHVDPLRRLGAEGDDHATDFLRQVFTESLANGTPDGT